MSAYGSALRHVTADETRGIVQAAFQQWTSVDCGNGAPPNFAVDIFPDVNCTDVTGASGYKSTGPNYNVWVFHDADWPYGTEGEDAVAVTTVKFNPTTGEIYDADVELNSELDAFTTGLYVDWDLATVVQHESGHFLGLAHTTVADAVMWPVISEYETRRTLSSDDIQGICAIYPPGKPNPQCDPEPRHGFSTECEFAKGCCAVAPGRSINRYGSWGAMLVSALVLAAIATRRRAADVAATLRPACRCDQKDRTTRAIEATSHGSAAGSTANDFRDD